MIDKERKEKERKGENDCLKACTQQRKERGIKRTIKMIEGRGKRETVVQSYKERKEERKKRASKKQEKES